MVMYWSPKPPDMSGRASYAETLYSLAEWLRRTLQDTRKRSTPYVMTDPNDRMGVTRNDEEDQAVTGNFSPKEKARQLPCSETSCRKKGWL